jgi:predicted component of type VI protein secretion system
MIPYAPSPAVLAPLVHRLEHILAHGRTLFDRLQQIPRGNPRSDPWRDALHEHLAVLNGLASSDGRAWAGAETALWRIAGSLAALRGERSLVETPPAGGGVERALDGALRAIETRLLASDLRYVSIPLEPRDDGLRFVNLRGGLLEEWNRGLIAVRSKLPRERVRDEFRAVYKLGSWETITAQVATASPGAWLRPQSQGPVGVGPDPSTTWFAVEMIGQGWSVIREAETLALYAPPPYMPDEAQLELVAERIA